MKQLPAIFLTATVALIGAGCAPAQNPADVGAHGDAPASAVSASSSQNTTSTKTTAAATGTTAADTTPTPRPPVKKSSPSKPASTVVVQIVQGRFSPQVVAAMAGDTIVWTNRDTVPHTTHSDGSTIWDTGAILPGKSASHRFTSPGTYLYSDGNTGIKGTVIIH